MEGHFYETGMRRKERKGRKKEKGVEMELALKSKSGTQREGKLEDTDK